MYIKQFLVTFFLNFHVINAGIMLWSNKRVDISPLLPFDDEDLENLVKKLDVEKVFIFKLSLKNMKAIPINLKEVLYGFYSSYNPNGNIGTSKAVELLLSEDCNGIDITGIQKTTGKLTNSTDFLCVLDITYPRKKRSIDDTVATKENSKVTKSSESKGTVIYIGKKDNQYALLYSSKALKLEINNTTKYLGNTKNSLITVDKRFNIPIILEGNEKVTLRFVISWVSGYWYLQTAKVEFIDESNTILNYELSTDENVMAPAHFSYHCSGESVFLETSSGTKLTIYDLQVQIDAKKEKFGDANDCVPFTTAPIWSGLFVTTILGLGLIVALTAIMDIKTMDKFDNQASKNLGITVMD